MSAACDEIPSRLRILILIVEGPTGFFVYIYERQNCTWLCCDNCWAEQLIPSAICALLEPTLSARSLSANIMYSVPRPREVLSV